jgi:translation initiation factor 1
MREDNPTVYSTTTGRICPKCGKPISSCACLKKVQIKGDGVVRIFRESKGRKGKTVTIITGISLNEQGLRSLHSDLKRICGSGGSVKDGSLEIQGDHRDSIFTELKNRGFQVKIAGG